MRDIYILIACEESQRVCTEFRKRGFLAFSCDIIPCSGGHPEWHIKADCLPLLDGNVPFTCEDGSEYHVDKWDMIIAHPPCTRLCSSGQRWLYYGSEEYRNKKRSEQEKAIEFFMKFTKCSCDHVAIENPVGIMSRKYRKPDMLYDPYNFTGETEAKKTCLWLKNLPVLEKTQHLEKSLITHNIFRAEFDDHKYSWNDKRVASLRSKTPVGVAEAMAEQWGNYLKEVIK